MPLSLHPGLISDGRSFIGSKSMKGRQGHESEQMTSAMREQRGSYHMVGSITRGQYCNHYEIMTFHYQKQHD